MEIRNTKERFGVIAMTLHWIVAALFLVLYLSVYSREWFLEPQSPLRWPILKVHFACGMTAMIFVGLRVAYKIFDRSPKPLPAPKYQHLGVKLAHLALYAVMIAMPLTGYFGTGANIDVFGLFEVPKFKSTAVYDAVVTNALGLSWEMFEKPMDFIHKKGGRYVVWVLILTHIGAALFHHFHRQDNTLRRMLPGKLK